MPAASAAEAEAIPAAAAASLGATGCARWVSEGFSRPALNAATLLADKAVFPGSGRPAGCWLPASCEVSGWGAGGAVS